MCWCGGNELEGNFGIVHGGVSGGFACVFFSERQVAEPLGEKQELVRGHGASTTSSNSNRRALEPVLRV
jgi:hypothetical protein